MEKSSNLLMQFDELIRCFSVLSDDSCEKEFLRYVTNQESVRLKWIETMNECKRLKTELDVSNKNVSKLERSLAVARQLVDTERLSREKAESERDAYANQLEEVRRILLCDARYKLPDETKERLSFLQKTFAGSRYSSHACDRLNTVEESDSSASLDISFSRSGDDLLNDFPERPTKRRSNIPSAKEETNTIKRKKPTNEVISFTPTAPRADSLESLVSDDNVINPSNIELSEQYRTPIVARINARGHQFVPQSSALPFMRQLSCSYCDKKSRTLWKCEHCHNLAHLECRDKIPLPCAPMNTPRKGMILGIADYAPAESPQIPAIVIHCINEVEQRGLKELGIYRVPGTERKVKELKEKFSKGKVLLLGDEDIHDVCSFLKEFLRELPDTLIPRAEWNTFKNAVFSPDKNKKLYQAISSLPQSNRDTLSYIILHLQHVASSPACKMPISNLATVFGPTIVGYPSTEQLNALSEANTSNLIMKELLSLNSEYWSNFISVPPSFSRIPYSLRNTPSSESLSKKTPYNFLFTPGGRRRFFNTPPSQKQ